MQKDFFSFFTQKEKEQSKNDENAQYRDFVKARRFCGDSMESAHRRSLDIRYAIVVKKAKLVVFCVRSDLTILDYTIL